MSTPSTQPPPDFALTVPPSTPPVAYAKALPDSYAASGSSPLVSLLDHLLQHLRLFAGVWLLVLAAAVVYLLVTPPVYRAEALLQVDGRGPRTLARSLSQMPDHNPEAPSGYLLGELEILRSRDNMAQAIARSGAELEVRVDNRLPLLGDWYARLQDSRGAVQPLPPPLDWPVLQRFAWGGETLRLSHLRVPRSHQGKALLLHVGNAGWTLHGADGTRLAAAATTQPGSAVPFSIDGQPGSLQIEALAARPGTRFRIAVQEPAPVYDTLMRTLRVEEAGRQSGVIRVALTSADAGFATSFVDALTQIYLAQQLKMHTAESARSLRFLDEQLPAVKRELDRAEEALSAYRASAITMSVAQENESALRRMADLDRERVDFALRKEQLTPRLAASHPDVVALRRQLSMLDAEARRLRGRMDQAPQQDRDLVRLQREVQVNTQLYTAMLNSAQEMRVVQAGMTGNARLVAPAGVLPLPAQPKPAMVLSAAAGLGLVLALGSVLLMRLLRPTLRTVDELEQCTGLHVVAAVPESAGQRRLIRGRRLWRGRGEPRLLALRAPFEPAIESLRSLRNSLAVRERTAGAHARGSVLITAPTAYAGKSFIAANLAALTAATGRRVLLIDLDLRAPRQHIYFGIGRGRYGLADVLTGRCSVGDAIVQEVLPGLDLLLSGRAPNNPGELLLLPRFETLIRELEERYTHLVIDSAPVLPVGDTLAVGRLVGTTYLVLRAESSSVREVRDALRRLGDGGATVDGLVLNGVKRARLANVPYRGYFSREVEMRVGL
jgi:tyrosine-protein kinase Etk/Wzc